jgi:hypothetical protein
LAYCQTISDGYLSTDFNSLSLKLNFAALDRGFGKTASFKKSRCPKPLIDAHLGDFGLFIHQNWVVP